MPGSRGSGAKNWDMTSLNFLSHQENAVPVKTLLNLKKIFKVLSILCGMYLTAFLIFFLIFGIFLGSFDKRNFGNPKNDFILYTGINLTTSSIDRFEVRPSFFHIDPPDICYELTLSPEDKARLINSFIKKGGNRNSNLNAIDLVPSSWIWERHPQVKSYYFWHADAGVFLDVDVKNNKAWFVISLI
ncbi:MAG TPA: hypothetical protein VL981_06905 [Candidatus Methylacidiphilales bacterium]|nr:hypothetical protein [Candidatus Methylacidiphilales bacterium]